MVVTTAEISRTGSSHSGIDAVFTPALLIQTSIVPNFAAAATHWACTLS
jgi:hypothetical protein